jgi:2-hydroxychromene-2-carboxylate isomerase
VEFDLIPVYPPKEFANDPKKNIRKSAYIGDDIKRFTDAYGLELNWPKPFDTDWVIPHSAYIYAEEKGKGIEFVVEVYSSRFSSGHDIGDTNVLKDIARRCELNENDLIEVSQSPEYQGRLDERMSQGKNDKIFGTPYFIYQGQKYWGNDRIDWLIRHIMLNNKQAVPDLKSDPFQRPY